MECFDLANTRFFPPAARPLSIYLLGFLAIASAYYVWTWSDILGDFGGDNAIYLLSAQYLSPFSPHSQVAEYFFRQSPYPPLFPLALALTGGGESLLIAHLVTTTFLLLALPAIFFWMILEGFDRLHAFFAALIFALLPGTYMQALFAHSENLYLLFSLLSLLLVSLADARNEQKWLWPAALCVAAASLTRGAGISLIAAFIGYMWLRRSPGKWRLSATALAPALIWQWLGQHTAPGYFSIFAERYKAGWVVVWDHLNADGHAMWYGWLANFITGNRGVLVVGILGAICLAGLVARLIARKFDGLYSLFYLLLVLIWPFPVEARRLIFVIIPILLVQGLLLLKRLPRLELGASAYRIAPAMVLAIIAISIASPFALVITRFMQPLPSGLESYKRQPDWYFDQPGEAMTRVLIARALTESMGKISDYVPEGSCIYSIKPSIVSFYSHRISVGPPPERVAAAAFRDAIKNGNCKYFYLLPSSPSFRQPFYPYERIKDTFTVVVESRLTDQNSSVVAVLGRLNER